MEGGEKYMEEPMRGCLSLDDPRTNKSPFEKREMVIDTIASISRDDEEAIRISMEAAAHCHLSANKGPDYENPEFDQWFPKVMRDFEEAVKRCHSASE